jgi:hypothetical protein
VQRAPHRACENQQLLVDTDPICFERTGGEGPAPKRKPLREQPTGEAVAIEQRKRATSSHAVPVGEPPGKPSGAARALVVDQASRVVADDAPGSKQPVEEVEVDRAPAGCPGSQPLVASTDAGEPLASHREVVATADVPWQGSSLEAPSVRASPGRHG